MLQKPGYGAGWSRCVRDGLLFWLGLLMLVASAGMWSTPALAGGCGPFNITVAHSGSYTIDGSNCGFEVFSNGIDPPGPDNPSIPAAHGTVIINSTSNTVTYRHDGDGATQDDFAFVDAVKDDIAVHVTILPAASNIVVSPSSLPAPTVGTLYSQPFPQLAKQPPIRGHCSPAPCRRVFR